MPAIVYVCVCVCVCVCLYVRLCVRVFVFSDLHAGANGAFEIMRADAMKKKQAGNDAAANAKIANLERKRDGNSNGGLSLSLSLF